MAQLKRYNGTNWEVVGGNIDTGDTLPINTVVEYAGTTVPEGYELVEDYSTSEVKTNAVWINSKPIYRKVILETMNGSSTISIQHNISNLEEVTDLKYFLYASSNNNTDIPNNNFAYRINRITNTTISGVSNSAYDNNWQLKIIIEYTKSTD